jgi:hypothetical protein
MYILLFSLLLFILHTGRPYVDDNDTSEFSAVVLQRSEKIRFCLEAILYFDIIEHSISSRSMTQRICTCK